MKFFNTLSAVIIAGGLSACGPADGDNHSALGNVEPVKFTGTYTFGGACDALEGTLSISEKSMRLTETVCNIAKVKGINTSSSSYELSDCRSGADDEPSRTVTISEVEDGLIEVSGWSGRRFTFQTCG